MPGVRTLQRLRPPGYWLLSSGLAAACLILMPMSGYAQGLLDTGSTAAPPQGLASSAGTRAEQATLTSGNSLLQSAQPLPVDEAFALTLVTTDSGIRLHWAIQEGYYLYRDKLQLVLDGRNLAPQLPEAEITEDEFFGEVAIYRETLLVSVPDRGKTLDITFQGCAEDRYCYPPATRQLSIAD